MARKEATATLKRIVRDGALTDAWCRSLVREGADVGKIFVPINGADQDVALTLFDQWIQGEGDACFPWLALAAPQAAAKLLVFAKTCRAFLPRASQMIRSVATEINAALERRGLPAPDGWKTLLTLTKAEHKAVLHAIVQLDLAIDTRVLRLQFGHSAGHHLPGVEPIPLGVALGLARFIISCSCLRFNQSP